MTLTKSLLLGSSATLVAVAGAQAADLPSKKAAPATYVKVCDAYGAGFFVIPGTDTCVKIGGYVRAEYQYVPSQRVHVITPNVVPTRVQAQSGAAGVAPVNFVVGASAVGAAQQFTQYEFQTYTAGGTNTLNGVAMVNSSYALWVQPNITLPMAGSEVGVAQQGANQSTTGYEIRGRIDVDARTPTTAGPARTFIRLRAANTSGIRNTTIANNGIYGEAATASSGITVESAMVQWAGFTFGVAPENYAMMPSMFYNANPWTGFPNGMKQIAYTQQFGGGLSATLAIEDRQDFGYSAGTAQYTYSQGWDTGHNLVANIRLDQSWGFAAIHGIAGKNTVSQNAKSIAGVNFGNLAHADDITTANGAYVSSFTATPDLVGFGALYGTNSPGVDKYGAWAIGTTLNFKLPMIAPGDQLWLTANYSHGMMAALLSGGGLSNVNTPANKRLLGGLLRVDSNLMVTSGNGSVNDPYTYGTVNGWNVAAAFTHYWASNVRSNFSAGYIEVNPPNSTATQTDVLNNSWALPQWGKGRLQVYTGSLVYSPAKDLDIGIETQYARLNNRMQNTAGAVCAPADAILGACAVAGNGDLAVPKNALNNANWTTKLRVERTF